MGAVLEDYGTKPVPTDKTKTWFDMGIVIWGLLLCIPAFMVGGLLGSTLTMTNAIIATLLGSVILTILAIFIGVIGAHTRMGLVMSAKFTFGTANFILAILIVISALGWFGIMLEVFGDMTINVIKALSNDAVVLPKWLILIIGGILMTSTAIFGFKALSMLSVIVVPLLLILLLVTIFKASADISVAEVFAKLPSEPMALGVAVSIVTGSMAAGVSWMPDITRYSRSKRQAAFGMVFGMMVGLPLIVILAAYLGSVSGTPNFVDVMLKFNIGIWALFALFVVVTSTWTTNDNNLYSAGLAFNTIVPNWPKWTITTAGGVLGTIAAILGIMGQFQNWMIALGVMITPMAAVMIVDFFLFKSHIYKYSTLESTPLYRTRAISWILGVIVGFITYFGVFKFGLFKLLTHALLTPALAFIVAVVAHLAIVMIVDFFLFKSSVSKDSTLNSMPLYRPRAYISWTLGVLVGFLTHFGVFTLTHASALDAIIVAAVAHLVIMLTTGGKFQAFNESETA